MVVGCTRLPKQKRVRAAERETPFAAAHLKEGLTACTAFHISVSTSSSCCHFAGTLGRANCFLSTDSTMEAFYGLPPATPLPRPSELGSPDSPQYVVDFDAASLQVKKTSSRRTSISSMVSDKSNGSNPISVSTTTCLTVTSDEEVAPSRRERRKPKAGRTQTKGIAEDVENSQSAGLDTSEVDDASPVRRTKSTKPKSSSSSSRHNWMSTMGSGGDFSDSGSLAPRRSSSRRAKVSDTVSLSAMSSAVSVQSETSDMGGSTASAMRKKKKKSQRSMSAHSSTLSVGSMRSSSRGGEDRLFSSASVGGRPRTSSSSKPSRRMSSSGSRSEDCAAKAAIRAADRKTSRRLSMKGGRAKSALVTPSSSRSPISKSVSFDYVEVREYARILSDNPAVRKGPPLGLDWDYIVSICLEVDEYEKKRGNRRTYNELQMPRYLREKLLEEHCDVTERELTQCMREIKKIKRQRQQSVAFQDGAQVLLEKAGRGLKRIFQKKSTKKEEDELWESAKQFAILKMQERELQDLTADVGDEDTVL